MNSTKLIDKMENDIADKVVEGYHCWNKLNDSAQKETLKLLSPEIAGIYTDTLHYEEMEKRGEAVRCPECNQFIDISDEYGQYKTIYMLYNRCPLCCIEALGKALYK